MTMSDFVFQRACLAMATRFDVFLRGTDEQHLEAVAVTVCEEIQRLDAWLSRFDQRSEIARINREATDKFVRVDRELFALLERCEQARVATDGYFDVTQCAAMVLNADACAVRLTRADAAIDMGAIGKGYALDCGREIVLRYGVTSGLLQGGTSSVLTIGDDKWPIDIRHPLKPDVVVQSLALKNCGFSCSAARHLDRSQSDVVNPHSGDSVSGDEACVVLAERAADAEIYSTALLAMGREKAMQYLEVENNAGWVAVGKNGNIKCQFIL
jgi:FAD:protein FMN transferase